MTTTPTTRPLRLYLAGPMTGLPDFNRPAFHAAAAALRAAGYEVVNPAELNESEPITDPDGPGAWERYMRRDIPHLCKCDAVALLPGWTESQGAQLEEEIAFRLSMPIETTDEWIEWQQTADDWLRFDHPQLRPAP